jgi:hypothetical protein
VSFTVPFIKIPAGHPDELGTASYRFFSDNGWWGEVQTVAALGTVAPTGTASTTTFRTDALISGTGI